MVVTWKCSIGLPRVAIKRVANADSRAVVTINRNSMRKSATGPNDLDANRPTIVNLVLNGIKSGLSGPLRLEMMNVIQR